jgi:hypothetical protein
LFGLKLSIAERYRAINTNHDNIISISLVLGTPLIFNTEILDKLIDDEGFKKIIWYKGISDLQPIINSHGSSQSRFQIVNQTKLLITHTFIGDEGFYTLKIQTKLNINKQYHYHVGSNSITHFQIFLSGDFIYIKSITCSFTTIIIF